MGLMLRKITQLIVILVVSIESSASVAESSVETVSVWDDSSPIYKATATLLVTDKFFRQDYLNSEQNVNPTKADFSYHVAVAQSDSVLKGVDQRLQDKKRDRLMAPIPVAGRGDSALSLYEVLRRGVTVDADVELLTIRVSYEHPDPIMAAIVANLFAEEAINYQLKLSVDTLMKRVQDLDARTTIIGEYLDEWSKKDLSNERLSVEYASAKKLYADLVEQLRYSETQVHLVNPSARILDDAIPPFYPVRLGSM